jgi:ATP-binding cassette subfamily B protein
MLRLEWRMTLVVCAFAPLPPILGARASREQTHRERTLLDRWTNIFARLHEVLAGVASIKSFATEEIEKRRLSRRVQEANQILVGGAKTDAAMTAAKNSSMVVARLFAVALGTWLIVRGELTLGTLVAFLGYTSGVFGPVQAITNMYQSIRRGAVCLETVFSILDAPEATGDASDAIEPGPLRGEIEFRDVTVANDAEQPALERAHVHVRPGEVVALVGAGGAGKNTFLELLQRHCDPTHGSVLVDGTDLRRYKQRALRQRIGVVTAESPIFTDTIRENIAFGRPGATDEEVERAARAANAHEFVMDLPEGYATHVGQRGARLSASQRRRIAIARALLEDPDIVIQDEPTAALDADSDELVFDAMDELRRGRTTFLLARRLASVMRAHRVLVFKDGRIADHGSHDELLARGGHYASIVRKHARKAIPSLDLLRRAA